MKVPFDTQGIPPFGRKVFFEEKTCVKVEKMIDKRKSL